MGDVLFWLLPLCSSALCFLFAALVGRQWLARRKPYQIVWSFGLLCYALATGTEVLGYGLGWTEPLYRAWYLIGAIMVAAYLGAGEVYLLRGTKFGYLAALSILAGALPALLSYGRFYREGQLLLGSTAQAIGVGGLFVAIVVTLTQRYRPTWVGHVFTAFLVLANLAAAWAVLRVPVDWSQVLDPTTGVVVGRGFPEAVRLLTPLFNIAGASTLVLGAAYSGWQFWRRGEMPRRAASNALIALGGFVPSLTSSLNRFGFTGAFMLGELLGVVCIFAGFLVSTEVLARRPAGRDPAVHDGAVRFGSRP